jgi:hypothetical protein
VAGVRLESETGRGRRVRVEAERDRQWLLWIGRFRFVTAELLALRFGVSVQNPRLRLRRLQAARLVSLHRTHLAEPFVAVLTPHGASTVGYPRRQREPRQNGGNSICTAPTSWRSSSWSASSSRPAARARGC